MTTGITTEVTTMEIATAEMTTTEITTTAAWAETTQKIMIIKTIIQTVRIYKLRAAAKEGTNGGGKVGETPRKHEKIHGTVMKAGVPRAVMAGRPTLGIGLTTSGPDMKSMTNGKVLQTIMARNGLLIMLAAKARPTPTGKAKRGVHTVRLFNFMIEHATKWILMGRQTEI